MDSPLELRIDGLSVSADGVGRLSDGRVVFVPRALPGDRVRVRLTGTRKRVQYAELLDFIEPSPDRVTSACTLARCSGCPLAALSRDAQARVKRQRVLDTLSRVGGIDVSHLLAPVSYQQSGWNTRHRVRLHAEWLRGGYRLGYFEQRSRTLVEIEQCPILWSELNESIADMRALVQLLPREADLQEVELCYSRRDARAAARVVGGGAATAYKKWLAHVQESRLSGLIAQTPAQRITFGNVTLRYDHARSSDFDLLFEPGLFTQANPEMNANLVTGVTAAAGSAKRVLELHAGIGNFSLPLRRADVELVAIERHRAASVMCARNAAAAGVELETRSISDTDAVTDLSQFDTVVLDPPRAGAREAVEAVAAAPNIRRVVYVSCDVGTLARDAALLTQSGFHVVAAAAFDMFPHTQHLETLLTLSRTQHGANVGGMAP